MKAKSLLAAADANVAKKKDEDMRSGHKGQQKCFDVELPNTAVIQPDKTTLSTVFIQSLLYFNYCFNRVYFWRLYECGNFVL